MDLVKLNDGFYDVETEEKIMEKGKKLLEENPFFRDLDSIMTQPEFRTFYDKYFNDISDMKTVLMYMKLYEELQHQYRERSCSTDMEKEVLAYMLKELISNRSSRRMIVHKFSEYFSEKSKMIALEDQDLVVDVNSDSQKSDEQENHVQETTLLCKICKSKVE
jgi:hypothetical protein